MERTINKEGLKEVKTLSDQELIDIADAACRDSKTEKSKFATYGYVFTYGQVTNELQARGYTKNVWICQGEASSRGSKEYYVSNKPVPKDKRTRLSLSCSSDKAEKLTRIIQSNGFVNSAFGDLIIDIVIDLYKNGQILRSKDVVDLEDL